MCPIGKDMWFSVRADLMNTGDKQDMANRIEGKYIASEFLGSLETDVFEVARPIRPRRAASARAGSRLQGGQRETLCWHAESGILLEELAKARHRRCDLRIPSPLRRDKGGVGRLSVKPPPPDGFPSTYLSPSSAPARRGFARRLLRTRPAPKSSCSSATFAARLDRVVGGLIPAAATVSSARSGSPTARSNSPPISGERPTTRGARRSRNRRAKLRSNGRVAGRSLGLPIQPRARLRLSRPFRAPHARLPSRSGAELVDRLHRRLKQRLTLVGDAPSARSSPRRRRPCAVSRSTRPDGSRDRIGCDALILPAMATAASPNRANNSGNARRALFRPSRQSRRRSALGRQLGAKLALCRAIRATARSRIRTPS